MRKGEKTWSLETDITGDLDLFFSCHTYKSHSVKGFNKRLDFGHKKLDGMAEKTTSNAMHLMKKIHVSCIN